MTSTSAIAVRAPPRPPKVESAWDWFQRVQREKAEPPHDPVSAAWAFCRGACTTGIAFVDAALQQRRRPPPQQQQGTSNNDNDVGPEPITIIDIRGSPSTAGTKTLTLVSLAARFVVDTRASAYCNNNDDHSGSGSGGDDESKLSNENPSSSSPHVYILDSQHDITLARLLYTVRATLLRRHHSTTTKDIVISLEEDLEDCLRRIHLVSSSDGFLGWVPILEALRHRLVLQQSSSSSIVPVPALILWDGFLSEPEAVKSEISRTLIIRLVRRITTDCTVLWFTTTSKNNTRRRYDNEWERHISQRIYLNDDDDAVGMASVDRLRISYQLSRHGVLP